MHTGFDSHLSNSLYFHLSYGRRFILDNKRLYEYNVLKTCIHEEGGGDGAKLEESRIIYNLAPGAKTYNI